MSINTLDPQQQRPFIQSSVQRPKQLKIFQDGHQALRVVCKPVEEIDGHILGQVNSMAYTMLNHKFAVALSANQVGFNKRIITMRYGENVLVLINPEIIKKAKRILNSSEGCLSVNQAKTRYMVRRRSTVTVKYLDIRGKEHIKIFKRRLALIIQHEIDHLDGILISDNGTREY